MANITELKNKAAAIKSATVPESVSASQVGGLFEDVIDFAGQAATDVEETRVKALTEIEATGISSKADAKPGKNIFNPAAIIDGKYINASGAEASNTSYAATDYIKIETGKSKLFVCCLNAAGVGGSYIAQYNTSKAVISESITNTATYVKVGDVWWYVYEITLDANCKYIRFGCEKGNMAKFMVTYDWQGDEISIDEYNPIGGYLEGITDGAEQLARSAMEAANNCVEKKTGNNILDISKITEGVYINSQGGESSNPSFFASDYIPITGEASFIIDGSNSGGAYTYLYDKDKKPLTGVYQQSGYEGGKYRYTPVYSAAAKYIRCSCALTNIDKCGVVYGHVAPTNIDEYSPIYGYIKEYDLKIQKASNEKEFGYSAGKSSLVAGEEMILRVPNIQSEFVETFYAKIDNATGIDFCVDTQCAVARITASEIVITGTSVDNLHLSEKRYTHGLTIKDYVCVTIVHGYELGVAKITLSSGGADYSISDAPWYGTLYRCHANVIAGSLMDIILSYHPTGMKKPVWMYGDSYFGIWTKYLIGKFSNYMLDAYYGVGASVALDSMKRALAITKPSVIVWCQGMNNWESAWEGHEESYQQWEDATNEVINICNAYGIELVLCTIPSTATHSNARKNAFVVNSGYRYIDVNNAVGDGQGTWYDGYLASDDIHPTDKGSRAIAGIISATLRCLL